MQPEPDLTATKIAMLRVIRALGRLWDAEGQLEKVLGREVEGMDWYFQDYVDDEEVSDEDVERFLEWVDADRALDDMARTLEAARTLQAARRARA
jgi:L-fucose isomerase-like protein